MENYIILSLETHLFFARIMKEHALFLEAGFPCMNKDWIEKSESFRREFETLLQDTVRISNGQVNASIVKSGELTTEFTLAAEARTQCLSGISINSNITKEEQELRPGFARHKNRLLFNHVHQLNQRALRLLNGLIKFKEEILEEVMKGRLYTANYPLLLKHIIHEAKLYQMTVEDLMSRKNPSYQTLRKIEEFWNQIMMEHALFIRGLLDPSEKELIQTANQFALDYEKLLAKAYRREDHILHAESKAALAKTLQLRDFKAAGTQGILDCKIASIILPLLADHVLREANHYIRLLEKY